MLWECSDCGGRTRAMPAPEVRGACGTAGTIFVRVDRDGPDQDSWRDAWLLSGLDRARTRLVEAS